MPAFSPSPWAEGLRRALPIVLGYLPVGFAFGVLAVKNNIPPGLTVAMSVLMFSGSGQFVFAAMWGAGAGILSIIAAVGIVNLRYLLQSAAQSPWMTGLPRAQRFAPARHDGEWARGAVIGSSDGSVLHGAGKAVRKDLLWLPAQ